MVTLKEVSGNCDKFKTAVNKNKLDDATKLLTKLKISLSEFPSLPPTFEQTPNAKQELLVARDVLEHAVLLSIKKKDEKAFENNYTQLKAYYTDTKDILPASSDECVIIGLNLLQLLVQGFVADFHTQLEQLTLDAQGNPHIQLVVQLEQWLTEGAYHKVKDAAKSAPSEHYKYFMEQLSSTVRDEIASCSEVAYEYLTLSDAMDIMGFSSQAELLAYAEEHEWIVDDGKINFKKSQEAAGKEIPAAQIMGNNLSYARELERIV